MQGVNVQHTTTTTTAVELVMAVYVCILTLHRRLLLHCDGLQLQSTPATSCASICVCHLQNKNPVTDEIVVPVVMFMTTQ